jgi:hypothetical protein
MIVSEWELPHCDAAVERVDVTARIVALFNPTPATTEMAEQMKGQKPLGLMERWPSRTGTEEVAALDGVTNSPHRVSSARLSVGFDDRSRRAKEPQLSRNIWLLSGV